MDKYLKAIKQNVCSICIDSNENGSCTLTHQESCAVEFYFPSIVDIVRGIQSENIEEYRSRIHESICITCRVQDDSGNCYLHDDANCSLDRYLPIIIDTIKRVDLGKL